jgi:FixJ family two-component response regulator
MIDDETVTLEMMKMIFEDMGIGVECHSDPREGLEAALASDYDLILVDMRMPLLDGAELSETLMKAKPAARLYAISGYPDDPLVARALAAGAIGFLQKPFEITKIVDFLRD